MPNASLDNHGAWMQRLDTMAQVVVGAAAAVFVLVLIAMALAVGFATRGAMAGNRDIIEALHFVGAADGFIARQFQFHFLRLGLRGGAAGGGAAILLFLRARRFLAAMDDQRRRRTGRSLVRLVFAGLGRDAGDRRDFARRWRCSPA